MLNIVKTSFALTVALTATSAFASDASSAWHGWIDAPTSASAQENASTLKASPINLDRLAALKSNSDGTRFSSARTPAKTWQVIVPAKTKMIVIEPSPSSELRSVPEGIPMPIILDDNTSLGGATSQSPSVKVATRPTVIPGVYRTVEFPKL